MGLPGLTLHFGAVFAIVAVATILCRGFDAVLRLIAGITAIATRDKRSRADRALEVLRLLSSKRHSITGEGREPNACGRRGPTPTHSHAAQSGRVSRRCDRPK